MSACDELSDLIARLGLVPLKDLRQVLAPLPKSASESDFLQALERQELLTSFQAEKLRKRSTDDLVLGDIALLYRNAAGSFARVYRGRSLSTGEMLGVKVLRDRWSNDAETIRLFRREGEIGKRLKHPYIVPIFDVGQQGKTHYLTMEFVEGGNLRDFLKIRQKLDPLEAALYGMQMAEGLDYALGLGITHRDLKLTNVLMTALGGVRLIDFGLGADESTLNRPDAPDLQQALEYSTLEKGSGAPRNDPRSDIFFLGTILFELISGVPPYPRTKDRDERKRFSRYRDIGPVTAAVPKLPHKLADVIDRCLHTNPELRYQRPGEVAADLHSLLAASGRDLPASPRTGSQMATDQKSPRILCVESRPKSQNVLRDYLGKRGYRVLLLSDPERAIARIASQPPDCLVLMGQSAADNVIEVFRKALNADTFERMGAILVLSEQQRDEAGELGRAMKRVRILQQPVPLRALRLEIESLLTELGVPIPSTSDAENAE
ncbi:MAG: protein kinase [Planctomycetaceae bacterium]